MKINPAIVKNVNEDGYIEFNSNEIIRLVRALKYTTKKRRIIHKVFKKAINQAVKNLLKGLNNDI